MDALKWILIIAALAFAVWRALVYTRGGHVGVSVGGVFTGIIVVILTTALVSGFGQVPAGTRAWSCGFGAPTGDIKLPGLFFVVPGVESVEMMSVQTEAYEAEAAAASSDLQDVRTHVTLNYLLDPGKVVTVYTTLRREYVTRIIKPAVQEAVKASTALFKAEELITRRAEVKKKIEDALSARLSTHGITSDTLSITDFKFSEQFQSAIEAKATATQQVLKAQRDLERIRLEAAQKIEQAKAEAQALALQKQNVTTELVALRRIEAQLKAIDKWDGRLPNVVTGTGPVPLLDVFQK